MRLIVMFDLPVVTEKDRKIYTKFRNFLLDDGYVMLQYSVYSRICRNADDISKHELRLRTHLPSNGNIRVLQITEKQFEGMKILVGTPSREEQLGVERLTVFE